MSYVFAFVEFYAAPLFFALGLIWFVYGVINYYIIGPGFEEERRQVGRESLVWATVLFLIGLILFLVAGWLLDFTDRLDEELDADVQTDVDILYVPDVPGVQ